MKSDELGCKNNFLLPWEEWTEGDSISSSVCVFLMKYLSILLRDFYNFAFFLFIPPILISQIIMMN